MTDYTWNGAAGDYLDPAQWTPNDVPLYGAGDTATIGVGTATLSDAAPNNITLALGATGTRLTTASHDPNPFPVPDQPTLVLNNAALGPDMALDVFSPAQLTVHGYDTNYGQINVAPFGDTQPVGGSIGLDLLIVGGQLNQEGTIAVISPQTVASAHSTLSVGGGTLNNDGQIYVGPGSSASFISAVAGSGTITVDHATASVYNTSSTQTIDLLGGQLNAPVFLQAMINDWNSDGRIVFSGAGSVGSVQFNQTSDAGGDLQLFGASGAQVGDLRLLGSYATADFTITPLPGASVVSATGHPSASA